MSTIKTVAKRIELEVGLSPAASMRIVKKLNKLAKSVAWARPVSDGDGRPQLSRQVAATRKLRARPLAASKARRRVKKKR